MRRILLSIAALSLATLACAQTAPSSEGETLFKTQCAGCHNGSPELRAPTPDTLRQRSPASILEALSNGAMRVQGSKLNGAQRHQIAEYLSGKPFGGDPTGAAMGRCTKPSPFKSEAVPPWNGWGGTERNERFQSAKNAGLSVEQVPQLTLKWAFGFPDATSAWATPTVAGSRVFVGSQNGTVYSLDANTGCIYWFFSADGGVRTAIAIGPRKGGGTNVYFGDTSANAYALDAESGKPVWKTKVEDHMMARITGSPTLYRNRLYVATSSYEESQMSNADYACCTFRGSVSSIDVDTGKVAWRTYVIPQEPKAHGKKPNGATLYGPSGAAIWSAPTIDATRNRVYVATGNGYTGPASVASDAVIAIDLTSGKIAWTKQLHENDVYIGSCWTEADEAKPECKDKRGPDYDIGNSPILAKLTDGKDRIIVGQKSGIGWALDPDKNGDVVWQYRVGQGGPLGGMEWGSAVDATNAYFPLSDLSSPKPGGLHAVNLQTGEKVWVAPPAEPKCPSGGRCNSAQAAAITVIPGAVFSGASDGMMRAFSTKDGAVLWETDTNQEFKTVNGVPAKGASIQCPGPTIANGMVFVSSGYGAFGGRPGNVLLAYGAASPKTN
jgi:polyvinyl alcohol dehydrogenase (cytochrome)